jgi:hypothetical protein
LTSLGLYYFLGSWQPWYMRHQVKNQLPRNKKKTLSIIKLFVPFSPIPWISKEIFCTKKTCCCCYATIIFIQKVFFLSFFDNCHHDNVVAVVLKEFCKESKPSSCKNHIQIPIPYLVAKFITTTCFFGMNM